ncbi:MAG: hypothetical protein LUG96_03560 [Tannerellaceae bacterium]|nr:hypothetical protein [Tannerellaceae bacterium]
MLWLSEKIKAKSYAYYYLFLMIGIEHLLFTYVYYAYSLSNVVDSTGYYRNVYYIYHSWSETVGLGTAFINFTLYPLVHFFRLSYFGCFFVYSFLGLLGFYYLISIAAGIYNFQWTKLLLVLLLPNLHFWTVGLGKDSLIFFAICKIIYNVFYSKKILPGFFLFSYWFVFGSIFLLFSL